jgi:hypothetical protein
VSSRALSFILSLTLPVLTLACTADTNQAKIQVKRVAPAAMRLLSFSVKGPAALGTDGIIVSDSSAALIRTDGTILTDAVAALRLLPYQVLQTVGRVVPVKNATFQVQTLDGQPMSATAFTKDDGSVTLRVNPSGLPLAGIAVFRANARAFRLATLVAPGPADIPYEVDPITTLMDATAREVVRLDRGGVQMPFSRYRRVWEIGNSAGVTVNPDDLRADTPPETAFSKLREVWQNAVASTITTAPEKAEIQSFQDDLSRF